MKQTTAAVITMVRDDLFFLQRWIDYYSAIWGRNALYVVNHGGNAAVADIAQGCNLINIPDEFDEKFDVYRWRLFNGLAAGLRQYFDFVIVSDVDEFLVMDPKTGLGLDDFLGKRRGKVTITPVGLEVVHKPELEPDTIENGPLLGPRKYARFSSVYSKPCLFNHNVRLSRGGHYASDPTLKLFRNLYLFHMRYVDAKLYADMLERRQSQLAKIGEDTGPISRDWRSGGSQLSAYEKVAQNPVTSDFDFSEHFARMSESWGPRGTAGEFHCFERDISSVLQTVPERFFGLV